MRRSMIVSLLVILTFAASSFARDKEVDSTLQEASVILQKIVQAEQKHLDEMGSYISAATSQEVRYNLEIEIPIDSYFEYMVHFSAGCFTAIATLKKDVGDANAGDRIILGCNGKKKVIPKESSLKKYMRSFLRE